MLEGWLAFWAGFAEGAHEDCEGGTLMIGSHSGLGLLRVLMRTAMEMLGEVPCILGWVCLMFAR